MRQELDEQLCREFPNLYRDRRASMRSTCMCWGFSHDDGWFKIIYELSKQLEAEILKLSEEHREYCCASQVKEKYGTLRFYMTSSTDEMERFISKACRKSAVTCEVCGKRGILRCDGGWYFTACKEHSRDCPRAHSRWSTFSWRVRRLFGDIKRYLKRK